MREHAAPFFRVLATRPRQRKGPLPANTSLNDGRVRQLVRGHAPPPDLTRLPREHLPE